jgi:hypothetical protein
MVMSSSIRLTNIHIDVPTDMAVIIANATVIADSVTTNPKHDRSIPLGQFIAPTAAACF